MKFKQFPVNFQPSCWRLRVHLVQTAQMVRLVQPDPSGLRVPTEQTEQTERLVPTVRMVSTVRPEHLAQKERTEQTEHPVPTV